MSYVFSIDSSEKKDKLFADLLSEMDLSQREKFFEFAVWELETHLKYGKDSGFKFYPVYAIERTLFFNRLSGKFCYEIELLLDLTGDPWLDFSKCFPEIDLLASKLALADFGNKLLKRKDFSEEEKMSLLKNEWIEADTVFLKQKSLWPELFKHVLRYFEDDVEIFFDMAEFNFEQLLKKRIIDYQ